MRAEELPAADRRPPRAARGGCAAAPASRAGTGAARRRRASSRRRATGAIVARIARALLVFGLCSAPAALAQIAFVQATPRMDQPLGASITSAPFPAPPTIGNRIVVVAWTWAGNSAAAIPAIADSAGNTYAIDARSVTGPNGGWGGVAIYSGRVASTAAAFKVTLTLPDSYSQIDAIAMEYSGIGAADQANTANGTAAKASVATNGPVTSLNELVVTGFSLLAPASNYSSISSANGYTQRAVQLVNAGDVAGAEADSAANGRGVQSNTWTANGAFSQWTAAIVTYSAGSGTPDHYAVTTPGTAVNCQPAAVTVAAHDAAHGAMVTTDTITLGTSSGHGDWSLTSGGGTFTAGAANSGAASYTYSAADGGVAVFALRDTVPETVTIRVSDGLASATSGAALAAEDAPLTFAPSGFRITNGSNVATTIGTRIAGLSSAAGAGAQSLALQAIRTDTSTGACTTVFASGTTANVSLAYQCNNPTTCVGGQTFSVTSNGTTTSIASNPASGVASYTAVPLRFSTANGEAPFSLNYSDVGQVTLYARYNIPLGSGAGSGNYMTGSSQFVVQPAGFVLSGIRCASYGAGTCNTGLGAPGNNPGAAGPTGAVFLPAGQAFAATVTAVNAAGVATPNYGHELSPESARLSASLVLPAGGHAAALNNATAFGAFSGGVASGTTFSWPEVGIITLTPSVGDGSYLGSGDVIGTPSGTVGRFVPASFATSQNTPVLGTGCAAGSFSYLGQPLTYAVAPVLTLTALAADGVTTTQNYSGAFLKLTNATLAGRSYTPTPASPALDLSGLPAASGDPVIADLGAGRASLTFSAGSGIRFTRGAAVAPFNANIALSINVVDGDGVAAANPVVFGAGTGISFSTGATQRYGRLSLRNVAGSELLDLPMPLTTQYYLNSAQGFVTNTDDACTAAPGLAFGGYQLNLNAGEACVRDSGSPGVSGQGCPVAAGASLRYRATAAGGDFNLVLAAPGSGNSGALTVTATAPAWLQYLWNAASGAYSNPAGMATFGVFPGPASRVYQREVY